MKIDITGSSIELAEMIKSNPSLIEKDLFDLGHNLIAIFEDSNFSDGFQNFREMKKEVYCMILQDLSMGAITLQSSTVGLSFRDGKIKTFITPFGTTPQGNVILSISLKNMAAFKSYRSGKPEELSEEDINAALYRMIVALSKVL